MKERGVLHPALLRILAKMGHGDEICIADAGLPIPEGIKRVDLAFAPGKPPFLDVVEALLTELRVEAYALAEEARRGCPHYVQWLGDALPHAQLTWLTHDQLKAQARSASAVVRTGEFTPYSNVLLRSGVDFDQH